MKTDAQKVWDALKKIYGKNLSAAVVNVLVIDDEYKLRYKTLVLGDPKEKIKEKENENT
jgi:hypothetical protein